jgi:hypothetical protein
MVMDVSERRVCRVAGQHRSAQRRPVPPNLYPIGTRLMKRLWRTEGLLVPQKRRKRRLIGTGENGIVRRRATRKDEVWGMDFVSDQTADDRPLRMLVVLDECTHSRRAVSVRSRSLATWAMLRSPMRQRRTASALKAGVNVRRGRFFLTVSPGLSMEHSWRAFSPNWVSTKSRQAQPTEGECDSSDAVEPEACIIRAAMHQPIPHPLGGLARGCQVEARP